MMADLKKLIRRSVEVKNGHRSIFASMLDKAFRGNIEAPPGMGEIHSMMQREIDIDVAEIYSPPRAVDMANRMNPSGGWSLDLTTSDEDGNPWDFGLKERRGAAKKQVINDESLLAIGSPMCPNVSPSER